MPDIFVHRPIPVLVSGNREQHPATWPDVARPLLRGGSIILDVLDDLEGTHEVERLVTERRCRGVPHLARADGRDPGSGDRARTPVRLKAKVVVLARDPGAERPAPAANLQHVTDARGDHARR